MTTQMMIRIDSKVKDRFVKLVRQEGKTVSQTLREVMEEYVENHDIGTYVDSVWNRIGDEFKRKGVTEKQIDKAIRQRRRS